MRISIEFDDEQNSERIKDVLLGSLSASVVETDPLSNYAQESQEMAKVAPTERGRQAIVNSSLEFMKKYGPAVTIEFKLGETSCQAMVAKKWVRVFIANTPSPQDLDGLKSILKSVAKGNIHEFE